MTFDPTYQSNRDETLVINQTQTGVDDFSTGTYSAIDEVNWSGYISGGGGGILWGVPPKWQAASLGEVPWTRTPLGVTDAAYDGGATADYDPGPRFRGALDLAPGVYDVTFHAAWQLITAPRGGTTPQGMWSAQSTLNAPGGRWEGAVNPMIHLVPLLLAPDPVPQPVNLADTITTTFDTRDAGVLTLWNTIGILGPAVWGRILHSSSGCSLTIVRHSDFAPPPPGTPSALAAGDVRSGRVDRSTARTGRSVGGPQINPPAAGPGWAGTGV